MVDKEQLGLTQQYFKKRLLVMFVLLFLIILSIFMDWNIANAFTNKDQEWDIKSPQAKDFFLYSKVEAVDSN